VRGLVARERIDDRFRIVGAPQVATQAQRRIRLEQLVFDRLSQDRAERARNAADSGRLQSFCATGRHELSTIGATQRANLTRSESREDVQREMAVVKVHRARLQRHLRGLHPVVDIRPQRRRRFGRCQLEISSSEPFADSLRDTESGLAIADPFRFPSSSVMDDDPPRAFPVLNLDGHEAPP
jgi:hypothetical protein